MRFIELAEQLWNNNKIICSYLFTNFLLGAFPDLYHHRKLLGSTGLHVFLRKVKVICVDLNSDTQFGLVESDIGLVWDVRTAVP